MLLDRTTIDGHLVRLEPLRAELRDALRAAVDCDPDSWSIMPGNPTGADFDDFWSAALSAPADQRIVYAIRDVVREQVVGMSTFYTSQLRHDGVEIGTTFIAPNARSTYINPATKLLMIGHAFEAGAIRVQFSVDERNVRSQAAVTKLGAVREGMLRRNQRTWTGHVRSTIIYSILAEEWPEMKARLEARIATFNVA